MSESSGTVRGAFRRELELVLMVNARDPEATLDRVAGLSSVRGYELRAGPVKTIRDVYFDTLDGLLWKKKMNLRIRETGSDYWITWKRDPGLLGSLGRNERLEIELPWSEDALSAVLRRLEVSGVRTGRTRNFSLRNPVQTMKSAGLVVLQDRETNRLVRDVASAEGVLAELSIDSVVYRFEAQDVRLDELEVEAKAGGGVAVLEDVKRGMLELSGDELELWRWGKLATGRIIESMLKKGTLHGLLEGSRLRPEAYEKIRNAMETCSF